MAERADLPMLDEAGNAPHGAAPCADAMHHLSRLASLFRLSLLFRLSSLLCLANLHPRARLHALASPASLHAGARLHAPFARRRRAVWLRRNALALAMAMLLGLGICAAEHVLPPLHDGLSGLDTTVQDEVLRARSPGSDLPGGQRSWLADLFGSGSQPAAVNPAADPRSFITIVAIDERTLRELGAYNGGYPRSYHAQVIENLLAAPPRVIALDLGFFEPTPDDGALVAALDHARRLPVPTSVILGAVGLDAANVSSSNASGTPDAGAAANVSSPDEVHFGGVRMPIPALAERADVALTNMAPDSHGTVRSMPLLASVNGVEEPTLGLAAMARYLRRPASVDARPDPHTLQLAGRSFPVDDSESLRINFFGTPSASYDPHSTFRVVSFVDVLRGRVDPSVWRGGLVFVGALGAAGLADDYWTPASVDSRKMAGVEIHANVAATLFSGQPLRETPTTSSMLLALGLAALVALLVANVRLLIACVLVPVGLAGASALGIWLLYAHSLLVPLGLPLLTSLAALFSTLVQRSISDHRHAARHDALTGLPNRVWLTERMRRAQAPAAHGALLLLDLDRFKDVNEALGYNAGDDVLRTLAARLRASLPDGSRLARLGGDEFAIWVPSLPDLDGAMSLSKAVSAVLEAPLQVGGREMVVTGSLGIAVQPDDGEGPETLLRYAEVAMYAAKATHAGWLRFTPDLERQSAERLTVIGDLPRAVANDELALYVQPKMACDSGRLAGVEALVRWVHPALGLVPPERFIGLAEEAGTIGLLTRWVLNAAVRQSRAWLDAGLEIPIAVNLSALDFDDPDLPTTVSALLEQWRVPSRLLSVEITETAVLADPQRALDVLARLAALGVRASLDDFGTGYSSLRAIRQLPLHELKIDRSFVMDMPRELRDRTIVRSTIELGHSLGLSVVAEGVEDAATFRLLGELGCDLAQGFLFSRPMPAAQLVDWIEAARLAQAA